MSPEKQRIAIAEACGLTPWLECHRHGEVGRERAESLGGGDLGCPWCASVLIQKDLPDYLHDLNAIHEAKRQLLATTGLCNDFQVHLLSERPARPVRYETDKWTWGQEAAIQAVALLRAIDKWEDES